MVVVSSAAACNPLPGISTYSACKSYASVLLRGLSYELRGKVDCMAWQPAEIKTKLLDSGFVEPRKLGANVISTETAVKDMFKQLGKEDCTHGNMRHGIQMAFGGLFPSWILSPLIYKEIVKNSVALEEHKKKSE
jgi:short-subunit dehydrogenase